MYKSRNSLALMSLILIFTILVGCSKDDSLDTPSIEESELINNNSNKAQSESASPYEDILIPKTLLMQKVEPSEMYVIKEEYTDLQIPGKSRYGTMTLQSDGEALLQTNDNAKRYIGNFNVLYSNADGDMNVIAQLATHIEEDVKAWKWKIIEFEGFDLFILKANQNEFYKHQNRTRNIRAFVVTENNVFPLHFLVHTEEGETELEELTVHSDFQPSNTSEHLIVFSPSPEETHQLTFKIDLDEKIGKLVEAEIIDETYPNINQLVEEQARVLEVILFYGVGDSQHVLDATEESWKGLLKRVSEQASQKESFLYITQNKMKYSRPFYWGTSDVRMDEQNKELFFTFTANVAYALGQDLRLQVHMTQNNDTWQFEDFGSLYIEQFGELPKVIIGN